MTIEVSPISVFDILSIANALMLGVLFITSRSKNNKANIFLGLFLFSLAIEVLASFLDGQDLNLPIMDTGLLTLPLLFLYVIKTLNYRFKLWYSLLLIPFLTEFTRVIPAVFYYGFSIVLLLYILRILKRNRSKLGDFYSDIEHKTLSWIKGIIYIYLFFHVFWIIEDLVGLQFESITTYFAEASTILTFLIRKKKTRKNNLKNIQLINFFSLQRESKMKSCFYKKILPSGIFPNNLTSTKNCSLN